MPKTKKQFKKGDWIVHNRYGVGQVIGVERKEFEGERLSYYKVKTGNSTFWVPVEDIENPRVRPVASKRKMQRALTTLRRKPRLMDPDHNQRKKRIKQVLLDSSLTSIAELLRDLAWRRTKKRLNPSEEDAMSKLSERFVKECSVSLDISANEAREKLDAILDDQRESVAG